MGDTILLSFEEWCKYNENRCWVAYHEEGANYDTPYDAYQLERYNEWLNNLGNNSALAQWNSM